MSQNLPDLDRVKKVHNAFAKPEHIPLQSSIVSMESKAGDPDATCSCQF